MCYVLPRTRELCKGLSRQWQKISRDSSITAERNMFRQDSQFAEFPSVTPRLEKVDLKNFWPP